MSAITQQPIHNLDRPTYRGACVPPAAENGCTNTMVSDRPCFRVTTRSLPACDQEQGQQREKHGRQLSSGSSSSRSSRSSSLNS